MQLTRAKIRPGFDEIAVHGGTPQRRRVDSLLGSGDSWCLRGRKWLEFEQRYAAIRAIERTDETQVPGTHRGKKRVLHSPVRVRGLICRLPMLPVNGVLDLVFRRVRFVPLKDDPAYPRVAAHIELKPVPRRKGPVPLGRRVAIDRHRGAQATARRGDRKSVV